MMLRNDVTDTPTEHDTANGGSASYVKTLKVASNGDQQGPIETTISVNRRSISGRPEVGEYSHELNADMAAMPGDDAVTMLEAARDQTLALFSGLDEDAIQAVRYAPKKWTIKDILQHLIDDERIYAYRALCVARGEQNSLPGFDELLYAQEAKAENRTLANLLEEFESVRAASLSLFASIANESWERRGLANEFSVSVRGLAFHIAAHEMHHLKVLRERYLPLLD